LIIPYMLLLYHIYGNLPIYSTFYLACFLRFVRLETALKFLLLFVPLIYPPICFIASLNSCNTFLLLSEFFRFILLTSPNVFGASYFLYTHFAEYIFFLSLFI